MMLIASYGVTDWGERGLYFSQRAKFEKKGKISRNLTFEILTIAEVGNVKSAKIQICFENITTVVVKK